jgi:D-alanine-D-alanine ligase
MNSKKIEQSSKDDPLRSTGKAKTTGKVVRTLGPVSDLERHLPSDWWNTLFNSLYLKTDGDVVENDVNTRADVDLLINASGIKEADSLLDVCCGQGRHSLELARRGYRGVQGVDRSRYLVRLARKRAKNEGLRVQFSEGDARKLRFPESSKDCVFLMGNSFGYFEREEDDIAVLKTILKILKPEGKLVLDIVDGTWMSKNFEPRSWEWIDQQHFVNRERSLAADGKRIITREVITHSEMGVIADQFYAERLYEFEEIAGVLRKLGYDDVQNAGAVKSNSTRGQDLGMMAHRLFVTCRAPEKKVVPITRAERRDVTVIFGDPSMPDKVKKGGQFNQEDLDTIQKFKNAVESIGDYKVSYLSDHRTLLKQLMSNPPSFVFNLCDEGYRNNANLELHVPAFLEMLGVPYSGAAPGCLALCYDKSKVRAIAADIGVPVPLETFFNLSDQAANIPDIFPALLKPACGDSSIGITQNAVVHNAVELMDYIHYLRDVVPGVPVLIQEYLQGKEYSVSLVGNSPNIEALPLLEVDYSGLPEGLPKILSYESKWLPESPYWTNIKYKEAELEEELRNQMVTHSKRLFEKLECRDYARFDFRCDASGVAKLLEVNPNPGWCWDGKFNLMAGFANISYPELLDMVLKAAIERTNDKA